MSEFSEMSGSRLVDTYNKMAEELGLRSVKRFSSSEDGRRRCEKLRNQLAGLSKEEKKKETTEMIDIYQQFKTRPNSKREALLRSLEQNRDQLVPIDKLMTDVYGKSNGNKNALKMVLLGLIDTIKKGNLPYEIRSEKAAIGLFEK